MNTSRFVRGLERDPFTDAQEIFPTDRVAHDFMQVSRHWGTFFSTALTQHLDGSSTSYGPEYIDRKLEAYGSHATQQHFKHLENVLRASTEQNPQDAIFINNTNFHTMSQAMLPAWESLLQPEKRGPLSDDELRGIQTNLAIRGLELVRHLPVMPSGYVETALYGRVSEIDTAITLLEFMRGEVREGNPNLALVPSPPFFEGHPTRHERTSDLIIMDTTELNTAVRGIQVKSTPATRSKVDPEYASLVTGATDLGNNVPGLISADFLLNEQDTSPQQKGRNQRAPIAPQFSGAALAVRDVAIERLTHSAVAYGDRAAVAARTIGPRILADLYRQDISA